jgi:ATP:corrinoid adenosyltransferase
LTFDVTDGKTATRVVEKEGLRFVLTAEPKGKLTIHIFEKEEELFRFVHTRPSTVDIIFFGSESRTYLIEATYAVGGHPIGLLSPGIRK